LLLSLTTLYGLTGCATGKLLKFSKDEDPLASAADPVNKVIAIWDPGTGPGLDRRTTRGFIGQILFSSVKQKGNVRVRGALRVYVFDDQGTRDQQVKPLHEFFLPTETLDAYYHHSEFGATYSIFVPYTRKGNHRAECTLRLQFIPADEKSGKLNHQAAVFSDNAVVTLLGSAEEEQGAEGTADAKNGVKKETKKGSNDIVENQTNAIPEGSTAPRAPAIPLDDSERERILAEATGRQAPTVREPQSFDSAAEASEHPFANFESSFDEPTVIQDPDTAPRRSRNLRSRDDRSREVNPLGAVTGHPLEQAFSDEPESNEPVSRVPDSSTNDSASGREVPKSGQDSAAAITTVAHSEPRPAMPSVLPLQRADDTTPAVSAAPATLPLPPPLVGAVEVVSSATSGSGALQLNEPIPPVDASTSAATLRTVSVASWFTPLITELQSRPILWSAMCLILAWNGCGAIAARGRRFLTRALRWSLLRTLSALNVQVATSAPMSGEIMSVPRRPVA